MSTISDLMRKHNISFCAASEMVRNEVAPPPGNGTMHDFQAQRIRELEAKCAELERVVNCRPTRGDIKLLEQKLTAAEQRCAGLEKALRGFTTKGSSLGASHPHLASCYAFPEEVWTAARHALRTPSGEKGEART